MFLPNSHPDYGKPLTAEDAETLGIAASAKVETYLSGRQGHAWTPLWALQDLAAELGVGSIHVKDEAYRLGLSSFKALGGAYAVARLVLEEASRRLGRVVDVSELQAPAVRAIASTMIFACATDGNHGRSVAQGAQLLGARSKIVIHAGVSDERAAAIARFGADVIRVSGNYDDSVARASQLAEAEGWTIVSDTSWPGYERIPGLVMQGYTALVREALLQLPAPPTHVFVQAGVGGIAAAVFAHLSIELGDRRPTFVVVDPSKSACLFESAKAGRAVKIAHGEPTVMAMLECYEPSLVAWRILSRVADGFMTVEDEDAIAVMNRLARGTGRDRPIVAGESGGVGLAGLIKALEDGGAARQLGLDGGSRVLVINTEGATDPARYAELVGLRPQDVHLLSEGKQRLEA